MLAAAVDTLVAVRERIYAESRVLGASGRVFNPFPTGMGRDAGLALRELVARESACRTIETGLAYGLSTLFILEATALFGTERRHVAIDPYQAKDWDNSGVRTIEEAGASALVEIIREDSLLALPRLVARGESFDLGFVDGGHHFENAFCDILFMQRLVRPGGLVIVDGAWMPAILAAAMYFEANLGMTREDQPGIPDAKRFIVLRTPEKPVKRAWDHFAEFR